MEISTLEHMRQIITEYDIVYIYGAGMNGQMVARYIMGTGRKVEAFLVSKMSVTQVEGIKLQIPEDVLSVKQDYIIVIGANESNRQDMVETLSRLGISNYITFTKAVEHEMRKRSFDCVARIREEERVKKTVDRRIMLVGYLTPGYLDTVYAEQRLIVNKISDAKVKYVSIPKEIDFIVEKDAGNDVIENNKMVCEAYYKPKIYFPEVDVIHTFNQVCITDRPWCASFETVMPRIFSGEERYRQYFERCMEYMQNDNCLGLFALCQNAYDIQKHFLLKRCGESAQAVIDKTIVLHPPQKVIISTDELERKTDRTRERITFIFIGGGFFFKGGREVIDVLMHLKQIYDFRLIVISSLLHNDFFTHASREEMVKYQAILRECEWIEYYDRLPNEQVLELCRKADVGLLPSFGDTYGYSVLEMQAAGVPVITSDIRAFTEINNEECGWIVNLPLDENKCCINTDMEGLSNLLKRKLEECFTFILEHQELIGSKGRKAYKRIKKMHDPTAYAEKLKEIYERKSC